jgi:hypothetical protein
MISPLVNTGESKGAVEENNSSIRSGVVVGSQSQCGEGSDSDLAFVTGICQLSEPIGSSDGFSSGSSVGSSSVNGSGNGGSDGGGSGNSGISSDAHGAAKLTSYGAGAGAGADVQTSSSSSPRLSLSQMTMIGQQFRSARTASQDDLFRAQVRGALDDLSLWQPNVFNEHCELVLQFCWVCFFSMIFPLGPMCALVNNLVEVRADIYKCCYVNRRPIPKSVAGLGAWFEIMLFIAYSSVLVNLLLMVLSLDSLSAWTNPGHKAFVEYWMPALLFVLGTERLIVMMMHLIEMNVPNASAAVRKQMKRRETSVRKSYMDIHKMKLEVAAKEQHEEGARQRMFKIGDQARVLKQGTYQGMVCHITDPDWGGRLKVQMPMPDGSLAIKSYKLHELTAVM